MFVIITNGEENASRKFSSNQIKKLITKQEEKGWEFIFLGANIDAVATAEHIGINRDRAVNYCADEQGHEIAYFCISDAITEMHESESLSMDWRKSADVDFKKGREYTTLFYL